MRSDLYITCDSNAYSILPSWVVPRVIEDQRQNDVQFVEKHEAILQSLEGDTSLIVRVVVDEPLTESERDQWISRVRRPLKVTCGKLLVCGGFDPDTMADLADDPSSFIDVPPGEYVVEILTYLDTMNGRVFRSRWGMDRRLGAWFRREHPGQPFPLWVASELFWAPEDDPGHEAEWSEFAVSVRQRVLAVESSPVSWVGVVIHFRREQDLELSTPDEEGFFPADAGLRRLDRFPSGIPSTIDEVTVTSEVLAVVSPRR